jgi:hypothetical protein
MAGVGVAAGAQALKAIVSNSIEMSSFLLFIFSSSIEIFQLAESNHWLHLNIPSQKKYDISCQVDNSGKLTRENTD